MLNDLENEEVKKVWRIVKIVWVALFGILFLHLFMGLSFSNQIGKPIDVSFIRNLRIALYILSVLTVIAINYIRRAIVLSKAEIKRRNNDIKNPYLVKYLVAMCVALGLAESIGIYGLVLYVMGKNIIDLFLLVFIAIFAMIFYRPKKKDVVNIAKKFKEN